ncbi:hypothetical protein MMYC01_202054 [Madurella mycetomatis]|uniref:PQ-loop-domain-containing protein n=1 Tax=Madurella mycetomatis TaxID=100816 RepID=A0A175WD82_9PEZI|nr:hypothetical protein MMYC01_202054 [Madurella mycetomatis]
MAPQTEIPVAANVLGPVVCSGLYPSSGIAQEISRSLRSQLIPQIWTNWRTKSTDGLPGNMMFLWALSGIPFGVYAIAQNFNIPLQVQPHIFSSLCLISWSQTLLYHRKWPSWRVWLLTIVVFSIFASVEIALIFTLKPLYDDGNAIPITAVGAIAAVLLAAGLLPPYGEIWKRRGRVIGINWIFLSMDWFGAFFSLMALVAQRTFDALGGVLYIVCCLLEIGIVLSHLIWLARTRKIRNDAAAQGKTFDDVAADYKARGVAFKFAERKGRKHRGRRARAGETRSVKSGGGKGSDGEKTAPSGNMQVPFTKRSFPHSADDRV